MIVLALLIPHGVFADEQEVNEDATVLLTATKLSTYTVKLPQSVDVSENSVSFDVLAKGDIIATKQLSISSGNSATLSDTYGRANVSVTVSKSGSAFTYDVLPANYDNTKKVTFTLTHATLGAGSYSGELPITISLDNVASS